MGCVPSYAFQAISHQFFEFAYVCNNIEAKLILQMPEDIIHSPIFQRETCIVTDSGQYVYTGRVILEVKKQNEEQKKKLTD